MSYILDALKKIELEKNRKVLPGGKTSITGDLFKERKQSAPRSGIWKIMVLVVVASLVTSAGTWFVLQGNSKKNAAGINSAASPPVTVVNHPAVPPKTAPVQAQPTSVAVPLPTPPAPATAPAVLKRTETITDDSTDSSARRERRSKKLIKEQSSSSQLTVAMVPAPAGIQLSGIAWQDRRSARRAVINGFLLKEGDSVSGAKITDIQENRVRFSNAAGLFEIKLDALVPTEVKR